MPLATCDISTLLAASTLNPITGSGPALESCCTLSLAACALHRTAAGWGVTSVAVPLPHDSWARCLPEMRACLQRLPGFPADRLSDAPAPSFQVLPEDCLGTFPRFLTLGHRPVSVLSSNPTHSLPMHHACQPASCISEKCCYFTACSLVTALVTVHDCQMRPCSCCEMAKTARSQCLQRAPAAQEPLPVHQRRRPCDCVSTLAGSCAPSSTLSTAMARKAPRLRPSSTSFSMTARRVHAAQSSHAQVDLLVHLGEDPAVDQVSVSVCRDHMTCTPAGHAANITA